MAVEYKNLMEEIVLQNLDAAMAAGDCCTCDICKSDVAAYALNHLPPRYVATHQGRLMVRAKSYETQFRADVMSALGKAVMVVGQAPHHDR